MSGLSSVLSMRVYWSLDELAWAYAALAVGWWLLDRGWPMGAGACMAFALCSRASYAFPVFAFLCWYWYGSRPRHALLRAAVGAALGAVLILAPFLLLGGRDVIAHNPLALTGEKLTAEWPDTNPVFRAGNSAVRAVGAGPAALAKAAIALAAIWYVAKRIGGAAPMHPFWHMCFAAFIANFLVYPVAVSDDYAIFFAVPAFLAIALSPHGFSAAAEIAPDKVSTAPRRRSA